MAFQQPKIKLTNSPEFREGYANSIQVNVSVWDFLLTFGRLQQQTPELVEVMNFQNIYLSPQQAKALMMILQQNVQNYEKAFGEIKLDPQMVPQQQNQVN
jgi:flagellar protein FlaG